MRVFKGKKLPGHMGQQIVTIQNLEIVSVDLENNIILVKGNVPGAKKSLVVIKTAIKNPEKVNSIEELNTYVTETPVEEVVEETVAETIESNEATEETITETPVQATEETTESSEN